MTAERVETRTQSISSSALCSVLLPAAMSIGRCVSMRRLFAALPLPYSSRRRSSRCCPVSTLLLSRRSPAGSRGWGDRSVRLASHNLGSVRGGRCARGRPNPNPAQMWFSVAEVDQAIDFFSFCAHAYFADSRCRHGRLGVVKGRLAGGRGRSASVRLQVCPLEGRDPRCPACFGRGLLCARPLAQPAAFRTPREASLRWIGGATSHSGAHVGTTAGEKRRFSSSGSICVCVCSSISSGRVLLGGLESVTGAGARKDSMPCKACAGELGGRAGLCARAWAAALAWVRVPPGWRWWACWDRAVGRVGRGDRLRRAGALSLKRALPSEGKAWGGLSSCVASSRGCRVCMPPGWMRVAPASALGSGMCSRSLAGAGALA